MYKKRLLLSAIFFDFLGKAAVFCVHKLKEKSERPSPYGMAEPLTRLVPFVAVRHLPVLREGNPPGEAFGRADIESSPTEMRRIGAQGDFMPRLESA